MPQPIDKIENTPLQQVVSLYQQHQKLQSCPGPILGLVGFDQINGAMDLNHMVRISFWHDLEYCDLGMNNYNKKL